MFKDMIDIKIENVAKLNDLIDEHLQKHRAKPIEVFWISSFLGFLANIPTGSTALGH